MVTDQGFLKVPRVVWETLNSIDGDNQVTLYLKILSMELNTGVWLCSAYMLSIYFNITIELNFVY